MTRFPGDTSLILWIVAILFCGLVAFGVGKMIYEAGLWLAV